MKVVQLLVLVRVAVLLPEELTNRNRRLHTRVDVGLLGTSGGRGESVVTHGESSQGRRETLVMSPD